MRLLQKALTFDDVLLVPAHSAILPRDVSLATRLTRNIQLEPAAGLRCHGYRDGSAASPSRWPRKAASASCTRT